MNRARPGINHEGFIMVHRAFHSSHIVCNIYDPAPWPSLRASEAGEAEPAGIEHGVILQR